MEVTHCETNVIHVLLRRELLLQMQSVQIYDSTIRLSVFF